MNSRLAQSQLLLGILILGALAGPSASDSLHAQDVDAVQTSNDGIRFDFQDMDLRLVITALAEAGGLNVVYSGLPQRAVTLRTNAAIPKAGVLAVLMSVAAANGLEVTEDAGLLRISAPSATSGRGAPGARDVPGASAGDEILLYVYRLKHARAIRLAGTLQALFGGPGTSFGAAGGLGRGSLSDELRGQRIPLGLPTTAPEQRVDGESASRALPGRLQSEVQIVPDELTNALLVRASSADWSVIEEAIEALDLRPLQVLIEVLIAEVRRSSTFDLGVSAEVPLQREPPTGALVGGQLTGTTTGDLILDIRELGGVDASVLISALATQGNVSILSRPVLLAQNNQEARILVGSQRPFIQVFRSLPTDAAVRDQIVQYRDVGTSLRILPTINHDGYVSLEVFQEVSTVTTEVQFGAPIISTREANTQLLVRDGRTVVIAGLIDRQEDRTRSGIPFLKSIPLLGYLFGSTQKMDVHTELFLFLTPHIIKDDEDAERLRKELEEGAVLLQERMPAERTIIRPDTVPSG